jgi:hypothetical protein
MIIGIIIAFIIVIWLLVEGVEAIFRPSELELKIRREAEWAKVEPLREYKANLNRYLILLRERNKAIIKAKEQELTYKKSNSNLLGYTSKPDIVAIPPMPIKPEKPIETVKDDESTPLDRIAMFALIVITPIVIFILLQMIKDIFNA